MQGLHIIVSTLVIFELPISQLNPSIRKNKSFQRRWGKNIAAKSLWIYIQHFLFYYLPLSALVYVQQCACAVCMYEYTVCTYYQPSNRLTPAPLSVYAITHPFAYIKDSGTKGLNSTSKGAFDRLKRASEIRHTHTESKTFRRAKQMTSSTDKILLKAVYFIPAHGWMKHGMLCVSGGWRGQGRFTRKGMIPHAIYFPLCGFKLIFNWWFVL